MKREATRPARSTTTRRPNREDDERPEAARPDDDGVFPDPAIDAQTEKMTGPPRRKV